MTRKIRIAIALAMAASLTACVGPGLTGNWTGGIIPWSPENEALARDAAAARCAQYGEVAEHFLVQRKYGQYISFDCRFAKEGPTFRYSH